MAQHSLQESCNTIWEDQGPRSLAEEDGYIKQHVSEQLRTTWNPAQCSEPILGEAK